MGASHCQNTGEIMIMINANAEECKDETHKGFTITCDNCKSNRVIVRTRNEWDADGDVDVVSLHCLNCGTDASVDPQEL